jgi:hypothetical protein
MEPTKNSLLLIFIMVFWMVFVQFCLLMVWDGSGMEWHLNLIVLRLFGIPLMLSKATFLVVFSIGERISFFLSCVYTGSDTKKAFGWVGWVMEL